MFARILGFLFFIGGIYLLMVFATPQIADQYGDADINAKIRNIKNASLQIASGSESPQSLIQNIKKTAKPYVQDLETTVQTTTNTLQKKTEQVQDAAEAVGTAYDAVKTATNKVQNVTDFSTGSTK